MREIKFRVWDTMTKKPKMITLNPAVDIFSSNDLIEEKHWKIMQFTGLKDKNGKEIYEGDKITVMSTNDLLTIKFKNGAFGAYSNEDTFYGYVASHNEIKIIGNIHEDKLK